MPSVGDCRRWIGRALALVALGVASLGTLAASARAATAIPRADPPAFTLQLMADHPLAGMIWDARRDLLITPTELIAALTGVPFVLLGEKHDNADHHALQGWVIAALAARGPVAVVMEQIRTDAADTLAARLRAAPTDAEGLGPALGWEASGWPAWSIYLPVARAALAQPGLDPVRRLRAGDVPREILRRAGREGPAAVGGAERWRSLGLDRPLAKKDAAALADDLVTSHCRMLPEAAIGPMLQVQRLRDGWLADALTAAAQQATAVLIAGAGHVRRDFGVPWYLAIRGEPPAVVVQFAEVAPGFARPADALLRPIGETGYPVADFVWLTPRVDLDDPCKAFAAQLQALPKADGAPK